MRMATIAEVKAQLNDYVEMAKSSGPIVITRNGKAAALLIAPADEAELEELISAYSPDTQQTQPATLPNGNLAKNGMEEVAIRRGAADEGQKAATDPAELSLAEREALFLQKLLEAGLISEIHTLDRTQADDWEPISIRGKPLSQTVIEDRR